MEDRKEGKEEERETGSAYGVFICCLFEDVGGARELIKCLCIPVGSSLRM